MEVDAGARVDDVEAQADDVEVDDDGQVDDVEVDAGAQVAEVDDDGQPAPVALPTIDPQLSHYLTRAPAAIWYFVVFGYVAEKDALAKGCFMVFGDVTEKYTLCHMVFCGIW